MGKHRLAEHTEHQLSTLNDVGGEFVPTSSTELPTSEGLKQAPWVQHIMNVDTDKLVKRALPLSGQSPTRLPATNGRKSANRDERKAHRVAAAVAAVVVVVGGGDGVVFRCASRHRSGSNAVWMVKSRMTATAAGAVTTVHVVITSIMVTTTITAAAAAATTTLTTLPTMTTADGRQYAAKVVRDKRVVFPRIVAVSYTHLTLPTIYSV